MAKVGQYLLRGRHRVFVCAVRNVACAVTYWAIPRW